MAKSRLTSEAVSSILAALRKGDNVRQACRAGGVTHTTFYKWLSRGEAGDPRYAPFYTAVFEATAVGSAARVDEILRAIAAAST